MALDLFGITRGLLIEDDAFEAGTSSSASLLQGASVPGGDGDIEDAASIGSMYMRTDVNTDNLQIFYKYQNTGSANDWKVIADKDYVDALINGITWRDPSKVVYTTPQATEALALADVDTNLGVIDGITLQVGDRVILADVGTGGENIKVVTVAYTVPSSLVWVDDTQALQEGDASLVTDGTTNGDTQWVYDADGTPTDTPTGTGKWILMAQGGGSTELGFIRTFIGKTGAGSEDPAYSSTNIVTTAPAQNLTAAISALDNAFGDGEITNDGGNFSMSDDMEWAVAGTLNVTDGFNNLNDSIGDKSYTSDFVLTDGQTVAASLDAIDVTYGDGNITTTTASHLLSNDMVWFGGGTLTLTAALDAINTGVGTRLYTDDSVISDGETITTSLDQLDQQFGTGAITNQGAPYALTDDMLWFSGGTLTLTTALNELNNAVGDLNNQTLEISGTAATLSATIVDSIPIADATEAKWMIQIRQNATPANRRAYEVHGVHNGTATDEDVYSRLRIAAGVQGVTITTTVSGGNFNLVMTATGSVDYVIKRISFAAF